MLAADLQGVDIRAPLRLQAQGHLKASILQAGRETVDRAAAPAVRAEGAGALVAKAQSGHLFHQAGNFRHHHIVHGGGAHQYALRAEDVGQYFVLIAARHVEDFHRHVRIHFVDALGNRVRHHAGVVGHGVVEKGDAVFLIIRRPLEVQLNDLGGVIAPYHAVGGGNHLYRQVKAEDLGDFRRHQAAERRQDVGVVALALLEQLGLVHFVVEQALVAVVLAEGVVAEQHRVAGHVGHHAVRPVQHRGFNEDQLFTVADIQRVAGFYGAEIPLRMVMVAVDGIDGVGGAVDRRVGNTGHQLGQRAGVVLFRVVDDDVVDRVQVDFAAQVLHELAAELVIDGIDQHVFPFTNQIAVVAAAAQRFVFRAVEITHFPVTLANPMNVIFNQNRHSNLS